MLDYHICSKGLGADEPSVFHISGGLDVNAHKGLESFRPRTLKLRADASLPASVRRHGWEVWWSPAAGGHRLCRAQTNPGQGLAPRCFVMGVQRMGERSAFGGRDTKSCSIFLGRSSIASPSPTLQVWPALRAVCCGSPCVAVRMQCSTECWSAARCSPPQWAACWRGALGAPARRTSRCKQVRRRNGQASDAQQAVQDASGA